MRVKTYQIATVCAVIFIYISEATNDCDCSKYSLDNLKLKWKAKPKSIKDEFDVIPMTYFNRKNYFPMEQRLVVDKISRKPDIKLALEKCVSSLNISTKQLIGGSYMSDTSLGNVYQFIFQTQDKILKVTTIRALAESHQVLQAEKICLSERIHMILPLHKRVKTLKGFLKMYELMKAFNISLTVVYMGYQDYDKFLKIVEKYREIRIIHVPSETFSRTVAVIEGIKKHSDDDLLLIIDVDVQVNSEFLTRCRYNTAINTQVYFPILFSLYNPNFILKDHYSINQDNGFWRDFGYGMLCTHRSTAMKVIKQWMSHMMSKSGWGGEDIVLFRLFLTNPQINVVRSTDPGIIHQWHNKNCSGVRSNAALKACINSKARNEASQLQLAYQLYKLQND